MANVPTIESGTATPGIKVAEMFRRKMKITITTRQMVSSRVNFTSWMESRMEVELSWTTSRFTDGGISERKIGKSRRMLSTTSIVLVPGWRWTASRMVRSSFTQARILSFSTSSRTLPSSSSRTGLPLR